MRNFLTSLLSGLALTALMLSVSAVTMSAEVEKSDYYQCVDTCEQECYLNIKE
jgi:uncharacterized protein YgiB involved in biofilm formation